VTATKVSGSVGRTPYSWPAKNRVKAIADAGVASPADVTASVKAALSGTAIQVDAAALAAAVAAAVSASLPKAVAAAVGAALVQGAV